MHQGGEQFKLSGPIGGKRSLSVNRRLVSNYVSYEANIERDN
jgi:hypothetical protein